jgi:ComEC/Rec2-related protein
MKPRTNTWWSAPFGASFIALTVVILYPLPHLVLKLATLVLIMLWLTLAWKKSKSPLHLTFISIAIGLLLTAYLQHSAYHIKTIRLGQIEPITSIVASVLQDSAMTRSRAHSVSLRLVSSTSHQHTTSAQGLLHAVIQSDRPFFIGQQLKLGLKPHQVIAQDQVIFVKQWQSLGFVHHYYAWRAGHKINWLAHAQHRLQQASPLFIAIVLGDRSQLSPFQKKWIEKSGLMPLFALSGWHLALLSQILLSLFSRIMYQRLALWFTLPIIVIYSVFIGLPYSLLRATLSLTLMIILTNLHRRTRPLDNLGLVLIISLLIDPLAYYSLAWQLSFAATAGILLWHKIYIWHWLPRWLQQPFAIALSVHSFTLPLLMTITPSFYLQTLITNAIYAVILPWIIVVDLLGFLLPISTWLGMVDTIFWYSVRWFSFLPWHIPISWGILIFSGFIPLLFLVVYCHNRVHEQ